MIKTALQWVVLCLFILCTSCLWPPAVQAADTGAEAAWPAIETRHRPGTYWWAPGSAYDKPNIEYNLRLLAGAGMGTVHIVPIYGAQGNEANDIEYLSPKWIDMLKHIVKTADSLNMQVDMTTGTGWCFGGPRIDMETGDIYVKYDAKENAISFGKGRAVKRAAPGGRGLMVNPFSPRSMKHYLEAFTHALTPIKDVLPRAQYHDSFEYRGNWCPELFEEFQKRRRYNLKDHLPALFGNAGDEDLRGRVRYDYRRTLAELHFDCMQVWIDWAHGYDMVTRNEAHGSPGNLLDLYAACDIPETEMFGAPEYPIPGLRREPAFCRKGDSDKRICMMAASAAHVARKPGMQLAASESCTWLREHWHTTLGQVKLEMDDFFLSGINHIFFHGTCYSPKEVPWPGWFFYASTQFNPRNAFWRDLPALNAYITRCQAVLQAGGACNDILLYWPIHDTWMSPSGGMISFRVHNHESWMTGQAIGRTAQTLIDHGYAFDFISDNLLQGIQFKKGRLQAIGGSYRAILVPPCRYMPADTARKLADLAAAGARVLFENALPADVPGLNDLEKRRSRFKAQRARLEKTASVADDVAKGLAKHNVPRETMADAGLQFIRRKIDGGAYYFIANQTAKTFDDWLKPALPAASVQILNPLNGDAGDAAFRAGRVRLQLTPGESLILKLHDKPCKGSKPWAYHKKAGDPIPVKGRWTVKFIDGAPELPASYTVDELACWTKAPDEKAKAFAGRASYNITFTLDAEALGDTESRDWLLDLGDVRESARIAVNGYPLGTIFCLPFSLPVGKYLKPGKNILTVDVINLSANRIRQLDAQGKKWKIMKDINIVTVNYQTITPAKWPLQPSGLLGPVTLTPLEKLKP